MPQAMNEGAEPIEVEPITPPVSANVPMHVRIANLTTKVDALDVKLDAILTAVNQPVTPAVDLTPIQSGVQNVLTEIGQIATNLASLQQCSSNIQAIIQPPISAEEQAASAVAQFNTAVNNLQTMLPGVVAQVAAIAPIAVDVEPIEPINLA